jgi:biotin carboxylase
MENKLLHIVGGGQNQILFVQMAKSMGYKVLVTDMYPDPPCKAIADIFEQVNTTDKEGTLAVAIKHKIDAIVTDQTDVAVPTVAYVAENLGLKGIGYETALKFTNKYSMREYMRKEYPECIPEFNFFQEPYEAIGFVEKNKNQIDKLVVKPVNSQGSKGVAFLDQNQYKEQIANAFLESRSRGILIEQRIGGFEFSVEAFVRNGEVFNLAVTKKYHYESNDCIDIRNTYLGDISNELESSLFSLNTNVIKALKLSFGVTHAEYKVENGRPYLMEIAARGGGGSISSLIVPYLTGFEPNRGLINILFDKEFDLTYQDYKEKFVVMKFFEFKPGKVKNVIFNKEFTSKTMVFQLDVKVGQDIQIVKDSRDRSGYFVVCSSDRDEVLKLEKEVEKSVTIEYE